MKTTIVALLVILAVGGGLCCFLAAEDEFPQKYRHIAVGMSIQDVESILGKGELLSVDRVPTKPDFSKPIKSRLVPVVSAEEVYAWTDNKGNKILVGFRNEKVVDKWFWEPSL